MNRIFSGIQPTGNLHLGNYLGAIRNWVRLQSDNECLYCIVDLHAITVALDPDELRANTREVTASLLAAGIEPDSNILFNQSQVPGHAELAWIFNCTARLGWLNRMTQFKEKAGKNRENASVGLYAYPTLMAADIMLYKATHVPVGEDQKQHLELARDIAQAFNSQYGVDFFPLVEPLIFGAATRVMSLRDGSVKMSKSDASDYSRHQPDRQPGCDREKDPQGADRRRSVARHTGRACRPTGSGQSGRHLRCPRRSRARGRLPALRRRSVLPLQGRARRARDRRALADLDPKCGACLRSRAISTAFCAKVRSAPALWLRRRCARFTS